jgi:endonuclease/exonuclease/phosphatase family metal-dependent hydrolase
MFLIGGDFNLNAGSGDAAKALGEAGFHDAARLSGRPTTPVHGLPHRAEAIDWIFVSDGLDSRGQVYDCVHESDHYPVSATIARSSLSFSSAPA